MTELINNSLCPRGEYPRPQFQREQWLCLNGEWEFEIDNSDSGAARGLITNPLKQKIVVPFCPESELSGIGNSDFMNAVWYRREVEIPVAWKEQKVLLHFGAVDYDATVWINGEEMARHRGGFTPFSVDISKAAKAGEKIIITVRAQDNAREPQPRGKQSQRFHNYQCMYTRTTGIWQTVWLEPVPAVHFKRPRITPDVGKSTLHLEMPLSQNATGHKIRVTLSDAKGEIINGTCSAEFDFAPRLALQIPAERKVLWQPDNPHLYDLLFELMDAEGNIIDCVKSYAGLRSLALEGHLFKINGKVLFQRLVLDQGYYPDGILTAPSDEALIQDIQLSQAAGFNGARLHQKIFEERFLYHADQLGYLCWGEFPDWGCREENVAASASQINPRFDITVAAQWLEELERDYSHPCIVGWCALNETRVGASYQNRTADEQAKNLAHLTDAQLALFLAAKAMDSTRPVLDTSGYCHRLSQSDIYDCHDYAQDPAKLRENHAGIADGNLFHNHPDDDVPYNGQPYFNSEFGGTWWGEKESGDTWGYGNKPQNIEEFYERFTGLCSALLENPRMFGYCYTQLTDVYQEQNGIFYFDRTAKFDLNRLAAAQTKETGV